MTRLTTLDLISAVMARPSRPLDFAILLHLRDAPATTALTAGAFDARRRFPATGSVLSGREWRRASPANEPVRVLDVDAEAVHDEIARYLDTPLDLRREESVQQRVVTSPGERGAALVTRFHHAAADGLAAMMWLRHQLDVVLGDRIAGDVVPAVPPELRRHPDPRRISAFAFTHPSDRLRTRGGRSSPHRRWRTLDVSAVPLRAAAAHWRVTYNDLLCTSALETFRIWNTMGGSGAEVGVWLPVNIRTEPLQGFGNGSSRIRVYNRYAPDASFAEKCRAVREQREWSRRHGEWALPDAERLIRLPLAILRPLLRAYFNRPWVDMGTGVFTHMERSALDGLPGDPIERAEIVGTLDIRHPLGIFAITIAETTHLTFVHDPAQLDDEEAASLVAIYEEQLALASSGAAT